MTTTPPILRLSEEFVQDCFHSYLKSSLTQARSERLIDNELLISAEEDLMITGPALCLYFAALRCTTEPPSVPLPRRGGKAGGAETVTELSENNCPEAFLSFLHVWIDAVPRIQGLAPEHQHDLARIICGLRPVSSPRNLALTGIAADLRAVAIEISQRRTFQNRYAGDLQAVVDAGAGPDDSRVTVAFVPPPAYDATPPTSPPISPANTSYESSIPSYESPAPSYESSVPSPPPPPLPDRPGRPRDPRSPNRLVKKQRGPPPVPPKDPPKDPHRQPQLTLSPPAPSRLSPHPPSHSRLSSNPPSPSQLPSHPLSPSRLPFHPSSPSRLPSLPPSPPRSSLDPPSPPRLSSHPPSPSYLSGPSTQVITIIRETLYAALADVIERSPSIRRLMKSDPPRAYFAAVAFAILDVATTAITPDGAIRGVMDQQLTLEMCPPELKPFTKEVLAIGGEVNECRDEDDADAIKIISEGGVPPEPRMERTRKVLENGVGYNRRRHNGGDGSRNRMSVQGRALTLANRINALALGMTRLKAFRDRQNDVFTILAGLGGS